MNAILALAKRVESLAGPCRETDALVALAKGWQETPNGGWFTPPGLTVLHHKTELPCYTASLDAALTLVPEGLRLQVGEWDDEKHLRPKGPWQAILTKPGASSGFGDMLGYRCEHAATFALAIVAAALRAKAAAT